jgi:diacylglycerol kinase (ATP)
MSKVAFYLNPRASGFDRKVWEKTFKEFLFRHELAFYEPKNVTELKLKIRKNIEEKIDTIFLVGGDGTINTVLPELIYSSINIVIIPAGTANDLACELGLTQNVSKIIKAFQYKTTRTVDVVQVNNRYFLTIGGLGIANTVVKEINSIRKKHAWFKSFMGMTGSTVYGLFLAKNIFLNSLKTYPIRIESTNKTNETSKQEVQASMIFVCNQETLGGQFTIAPGTKNNDGYFSLIIFTHSNKRDLIKAISAIKNGKFPLEDPAIIRIECNKVSMKLLNSERIPFFGDGEELGINSNFEISILPMKLNFLCLDHNYHYDKSYSLENIARI